MNDTRRAELFQSYMGIVNKRAKRFKTLDRDDLRQAGYIKLLELVDRFGENLTGGLVIESIKNHFADILRKEIKEPKTLMYDTVRTHDADDPKHRENAIEYPLTDRARGELASDCEYPDILLTKKALSCLTPEESQVIQLRVREHSTTEVAQELEVDRKTIQRLETSALKKLALLDVAWEFPTALWRVILLTAIANGLIEPKRFEMQCQMAEADLETMKRMDAETAKKHLTHLRKRGF